MGLTMELDAVEMPGAESVETPSSTNKEFDLDATVNSAYDAIENKSEEGEPEDTTNKLDAEEEVPEKSEEVKAETSEAEEPAQATQATEGMSNALTEAYNGMPDDAKKEVDSLLSFKKENEPKLEVSTQLDTIYEQHQDRFAASNIERNQAIEYLLNKERELWIGTPEQKIAAIKKIASDYGIPIESIGGKVEANNEQEEEIYSDPQIAALQKKIDQLESRESERQQSINKSEWEKAGNLIGQLKEEKDGEGNLLRPYWDEVEKQMAQLIRSGQVKDPKTAYENAIWANPTIREKMLSEQKTKQEEKENKDSEEHLAKAKKAAAVNVKSENSKPKRKVSWDQDLERIYDEAVLKT